MSATSRKFTVKSSDVISDMRVNVLEEGTETVIWYKERFLSDDEIVEHLFDNANSTICWTIHRPKRGWYIRLRAPSFPPGVFIPLAPIPKASPYHTDAGITFSCRTDTPAGGTSGPQSPPSIAKMSLESDTTLAEILASPSSSSSNIVHSYPPTPPAQFPSLVIQPPSPNSVNAKLEDIDTPIRRKKSTQITQFLLAPHSTSHVPAQQNNPPSVFTRVFSAFKNHAPSHSYSFTLSPIPQTPSRSIPHHVPYSPTPLLTFHDRTPVLALSSTTGLLEIDEAEERLLGVSQSFWIAIALTYLDFLADRESYLAAITD